MNLRKHARGKSCKVRLPGICNGDAETTVLAHPRLPGITGMGTKAPDVMGAHACSACHAEVDRVTRILESDYVRLAFYEGILRTQDELVSEGVLHW